MNYYKKAGARNEEEQALLQAIELVIEEKSINRNDIPECHTVDDLVEVKHLVDAYTKADTESVPVDTAESPEEIQITEEDEFNSDHPEIENIENEPESVSTEQVIDVSDSEQLNSDISDQIETESIPTEDHLNFEDGISQDEEIEFDSGDYDPFASQIIERSYSGADELEPFADPNKTDSSTSELNLEESQDGLPFSSPEERTKKKAAEQTADTILKGYARLVPKPFKWLSKFSESRIEKMSFNGQLDLNIEVSPGVTFDDYVKQTNEQIDEIFEVDEDTLEEIREPLVEVLMEQQLELTPQQRLGMAVLSHLMQMFTISMKLRTQNNRILAYQKEMTRLAQTNVA